MAVAYKATSAAVQRASTTSGGSVQYDISIDLPTGWADGDFCIIPLEVRSLNALGTLPTGWALKTPGQSSIHSGYLIWKRLVTGDATPVVIPTFLPNRGVSCGAAITFTGVKSSGDPFGTAAVTTGDTSPSSAVSITTTAAGSYAAVMNAQAGTSTLTPASGFTELLDYTTGSGDDAGINVQGQAVASSGTTVTDASRTQTAPAYWVKIAFELLTESVGGGFTSTLQARNGGTWKTASALHVKLSGTWTQATSVHVKSGGTWQQVM